MTIIWAKQFNDRWALFTDDCISFSSTKISASKQYRPKLKEVEYKNVHLVIASSWWTKVIDFLTNIIEAKINSSKVKDATSLQFILQTAIIEGWKAVKEIETDPSSTLLILETNSNMLWEADDYALTYIAPHIEVVSGSWEINFYKFNRNHNFVESFFLATEANEYCEFPIYVYMDWQMFSFDYNDSPLYMEDILNGYVKKNGRKKIHSTTA